LLLVSLEGAVPPAAVGLVVAEIEFQSSAVAMKS